MFRTFQLFQCIIRNKLKKLNILYPETVSLSLPFGLNCPPWNDFKQDSGKRCMYGWLSSLTSSLIIFLNVKTAETCMFQCWKIVQNLFQPSNMTVNFSYISFVFSVRNLKINFNIDSDAQQRIVHLRFGGWKRFLTKPKLASLTTLMWITRLEVIYKKD